MVGRPMIDYEARGSIQGNMLCFRMASASSVACVAPYSLPHFYLHCPDAGTAAYIYVLV